MANSKFETSQNSKAADQISWTDSGVTDLLSGTANMLNTFNIKNSPTNLVDSNGKSAVDGVSYVFS